MSMNSGLDKYTIFLKNIFKKIILYVEYYAGIDMTASCYTHRNELHMPMLNEKLDTKEYML